MHPIMEITLKEPRLTQDVLRWADYTSQSAEAVVEAAVEAYLAQLEAALLEKDTFFFWNNLDELRRDYPHEYVAIHQGEVVDHDADLRSLSQRVRQRFGNLPVLMASVDNPPPHDIHWRSPRR